MPSSGSTTQRTWPAPASPMAPPSSPRIASPGRAARIWALISSSAVRSISVTTSVGLDLVSATSGRPLGPAGRPAPASRPPPRRPRSPGRAVPGIRPVHRSAPDPAGGRAAGNRQQSFGQKSGATGSEPSAGTCAGWPRRSFTSSVIMETKRGSVPGVAALTIGRPSAARQLRRLGVEVEHDLHVVGDEADRDHHHGCRAAPGQLGELVTHVGAQPRHRGRPAAALVGQPPVALAALGSRQLSGDQPRRLGQLRRVQAAGGPAGRRHRLGHAVRREHEPSIIRYAGRQLAVAARAASATEPIKPGWLKK